MPSRGLIPDRGKRAFAKWLATAVTHGAVGRVAWPDPFNPTLESYSAGGLADEIGRVPIKAVRYLIPDVSGTLTFDGDAVTYRYATQTEIDAAAADAHGPLAPSADVEFEFEITPNTINGEVVGEIGLFIGSTTAVSTFATPVQTTQIGQIAYVVRISADSIYADKLFNRRVRIDNTN